MSGKILLKVTLLGDAAVGKTSLRNQYMGKGYNASHLMTIGADFSAAEKIIEYNGRSYKTIFQIWDLAGQQRFQSVRIGFYKGSLGGLCLFDITREESFNSIPRWIEELWRNSGKGPTPIILVGNKSDLRDRKSISRKKAEEYAKMLSDKTMKYGFDVPYIETSAKTGENIDLAFDMLGKKIFQHRKNIQT